MAFPFEHRKSFHKFSCLNLSIAPARIFWIMLRLSSALVTAASLCFRLRCHSDIDEFLLSGSSGKWRLAYSRSGTESHVSITLTSTQTWVDESFLFGLCFSVCWCWCCKYSRNIVAALMLEQEKEKSAPLSMFPAIDYLFESLSFQRSWLESYLQKHDQTRFQPLIIDCNTRLQSFNGRARLFSEVVNALRWLMTSHGRKLHDCATKHECRSLIDDVQ